MMAFPEDALSDIMTKTAVIVPVPKSLLCLALFRRIFNEHHILVHIKPTNTLRQKLVHPKDKTPRYRQSNVVYAVQCSQACTDL